MSTPTVSFESADQPGRQVAINPDPQTVVTPGAEPDTARVTPRQGETVTVAGDYRQVQVDLQAAAAVAHERGDNRPDHGGDPATVRELADHLLAGRPGWAEPDARAAVIATRELGPEGRAAIRRELAARGDTGPAADGLARAVEKRVVRLIEGLADDQPATGAD